MSADIVGGWTFSSFKLSVMQQKAADISDP